MYNLLFPAPEGGYKIDPPTSTLKIVMQTLTWGPHQDWMKICSFQYNL